MKWLPLFILLLMILNQAAASEVVAPPHDNTPVFERYSILSQRNIFSKNRGRVREEPKTAEAPKEKETPAAPKPEPDFVLSGILQKDGQLVAFVENSKTGAVQSVKSGDVIARGTIAAITLESLDYVCEGTTTKVQIGNNFEGNAAGKLTDAKPATPAASASGTAAPPSSPADAETNSIIERLRKRRQEEMKK